VVFAAIVLSQQLSDVGLVWRVVVVFAAFCAVSSAVYLVNDLVDIESDRLHPEKRFRPLASGQITGASAVALAVALASTGILAVGMLAVRDDVSPLLPAAVLAYLVLQTAYSLWLKHVVIMDVLAIAGGFVLRVLAGGAAINTIISPYLYLSMINLALFQGFAKRQSELRSLADSAADHRRSLGDYTASLLDQLITITATATIVTYALYAITTPHRPAAITPNALLITVPLVMYAMFRYLYLVQVRGLGGAPEDILLRDGPFLGSVVVWGLTLLALLYVVPRWPLLGG